MTDASASAPPPPAIDAVMREQALAVGYTPASARDGFAALLDLDHQLASILQSTTEPMIGQMRLTWWYEALEKLDHEPAPAHPVLQRLADLVLPGGVRGADLAPMIEGWEALLDDGEALVCSLALRPTGGAHLGHIEMAWDFPSEFAHHARVMVFELGGGHVESPYDAQNVQRPISSP